MAKENKSIEDLVVGVVMLAMLSAPMIGTGIYSIYKKNHLQADYEHCQSGAGYGQENPELTCQRIIAEYEGAKANLDFMARVGPR